MDEKNNQKYFKWAKDFAPKTVPDNVIPYISEKPDDRNLSIGDIVWLVLQKKIPLALNGGTGRGKTSTVEYFCNRNDMHLSLISCDPSTTRDKTMFQISQDPNSGKLITLPGPSMSGAINKGVVCLDEAATIDSDNFSGFNTIIQNKRPVFNTHLGPVSPSWDDVLFVISGNFHYSNPNFNPATLYRFAWIEFDRISGEGLELMAEYRFTQKYGLKQPEIPKKYIPKDLPSYTPSQTLYKTITKFGAGLWEELSDFADLNTSKSDRKNGIDLTKKIRSMIMRDEDIETEPVNPLEKYLGKSKWVGAGDLSAAVIPRMIELYHPDETQKDYEFILNCILTNPIVATASTPFNPAVKGYKEGMEQIVHDRLDSWWSEIKNAER